MESSHIPNTPGSVFQHRMDIGAEFRRIHGRLLLLPQMKAILQEIGQSALCVGINLGSGEIQCAPIELSDPVTIHPAHGVASPAAGFPIAFRNPQRIRLFLRVPPCQPGTSLPGIGAGIVHGRYPLFLAAGQLRQTAEHKGGLLSGAEHPNALLRTAEYTVDFREFRLNAFHSAAGKGNAKLPQSYPLLIRQHTGGTGISGKTSFLSAQQNQVLLLMTAHGADRAHLHSIQNRRDGSHVILAQQQSKKP